VEGVVGKISSMRVKMRMSSFEYVTRDQSGARRFHSAVRRSAVGCSFTCLLVSSLYLSCALQSTSCIPVFSALATQNLSSTGTSTIRNEAHGPLLQCSQSVDSSLRERAVDFNAVYHTEVSKAAEGPTSGIYASSSIENLRWQCRRLQRINSRCVEGCCEAHWITEAVRVRIFERLAFAVSIALKRTFPLSEQMSKCWTLR